MHDQRKHRDILGEMTQRLQPNLHINYTVVYDIFGCKRTLYLINVTDQCHYKEPLK